MISLKNFKSGHPAKIPLAAFVMVLPLAGCAGRPVATSEPTLEERYASLSTQDASSTRAAPRGTSEPVRRASELAPILGGAAPTGRVQADEKRSGGRRLRIVLDPGPNGTSGWVSYASAPDAETLRAADAPPSEEGIRSELRRFLPTSSMRVLNKPRHNRFGDYGLAVGIDGTGQRCVYGWQWIEGISSIHGAGSVRAALCSKALRLDDLAAMLDGAHLDSVDTLARATADNPARRTNARKIPVLARSADEAVVRHRRTAAIPAQDEPSGRRLRIARDDDPRASADTPRTIMRAGAGVALEPAFRPAPELDLPTQALRGPAQAAGQATH